MGRVGSEVPVSEFSHFKLCGRPCGLVLGTPLKGSLQPKLKGTSVWPFNTRNKVPTG